MVKKVLIVEDDTTFANAIAQTVQRVGYSSVICGKPDEALETLERETFSIVFIDCLLPNVPGTDLAKKIRKTFGPNILTIVMMSGVFTDKQTMREIISETQAKDFLKKPFDANFILNYLEKEVTVAIDDPFQKNIFTIYDRITAQPKDLEQNLTQFQNIHGFEIPALLSSLVDLRFSGKLEFKSENNNPIKIQFFKGSIINVENKDAQSFIGKLLLSRGYIFVEDLESILKVPSDKKLATRLLEENLLSPHAFDEVLQDQISIRISKIISDVNFKVSASFEEDVFDGASISAEEFPAFMADWIVSRIPESWLSKELLKWHNFSFKLGAKYSSESKELNSSIFTNIKQLLIDLTRVSSLSHLMTLYAGREQQVYHAIYYLLSRGFVVFSEKVAMMSDEERFIRLQNMSVRLQNMNLIEVFDMMGGKKGATANEVKVLQTEFIKKHLGNAPPRNIPGFENVYFETKKIIDKACDLFLNPKEVLNYENKVDTQKATDKINAQKIIVEARKFLSLNQYQQALKILSEINPQLILEHKNLLTMWARLGLFEQSQNKLKEMQDIELLYGNVVYEEKISTLGNFIMGLMFKTKGDFQVSKKYFETALALDKNFIEARRELNIIQALISKNKAPDLLNGDLKEVVGFFLKGSRK